MNVLIVGSGGREHAIGWKISQSPLLTKLYFAPGNAGTAALGQNLPISITDTVALIAAAQENNIDLVIVGPETALAVGLVDALQKAGIPTFGPTCAAAEIETSKAFAKTFMQRHNIPTASFACFEDEAEALEYLHILPDLPVIKASGLAAGKGVLLPQTLAEAETALHMLFTLRPGETVILEERLQGEEISLLAFTDGLTLKTMPPAQDHKRLLDGDNGPNTGGMGAYAPAPACPTEMVKKITDTILQPVLDGLRTEGRPFCGVLYAGLILTADGPKVLEFNARFGDPETQVLLPLLESDLLEIALACINGQLQNTSIHWRPESAVCIILAAPGYPETPQTGQIIQGLEQLPPQILAFHAGTRQINEQFLTNGGRVLGITTRSPHLADALHNAYTAIQSLSFPDMHYRNDIGQRALSFNASAYHNAGVDISAGNRAVQLMSQAVRATYTPAVLAGIGAFGGLFDAAALKAMRHPVLVASTDGVGTKVKLAAATGRYASIGHDIVNHCIDDILVQGAEPLFFLDYFATARLQPEIVAEIVAGMAEACQLAGCVLLGGETAEMPGVYSSGEFDVAGTIVGCLEKEEILPRTDLQPGDLLIGLRSSGPHTNGYSLIRKIFANAPLQEHIPELGQTLAEALLAPHRSYLHLLRPILHHPDHPIKALAHLTGGGFIENIPRILPPDLDARLHLGSWPVPPLFRLIQGRGHIMPAEMYRVFNMGIGMVAIVARSQTEAVQAMLSEESWIIGELIPGNGRVVLA
jgi:phosphoribosylamine--glycine ligase/phosphoribosylaminoimidazole synthetase